MEKIKSRPCSIKRSFTAAIAITMLVVSLCSIATIYGCYRIQKYILPDSNALWIQYSITYADGNRSEGGQRVYFGESFQIVEMIAEGQTQERDGAEYVIDKIESSFESLSPRRKLLYQAMGVSMAALPLFYSVIGIAICAWWFYRKKIAPPVQILAEATEHIGANDLDFQVPAAGQDELGRLCEAFEKMRQTLYENNREMWRMLEDRRTLQASVAHDLRNPIAIMEGYIEYMQQNLPGGKLTGEKLVHTLSNLAVTAKRLERYTDGIRDLHGLEETELNGTDAAFPDFLEDIAAAFAVVAGQQGKRVAYSWEGQPCTVVLDQDILSRILENVFANALRYADEKICLTAACSENRLSVSVVDDGPGFSAQMLSKKAALFYSEDTTGEHMGIGLAASRILCQRHGGGMELSNVTPHGACVSVTVAIKTADRLGSHGT